MDQTNFSEACQKILDGFRATGIDFDALLGRILYGRETSHSELVNYAQTFSNEDLRGNLIDAGILDHSTGKHETVEKFELLKLMLQDDRYSSYMFADHTEGLSDLRETYLDGGPATHFYDFFVSKEFNIKDELDQIAANTRAVSTKKFAIRRNSNKTMRFENLSQTNSALSIVQRIYQISYQKILGSDYKFDSNLERVTSAILATYLAVKAVDLRCYEIKDCEARVDEALKLSFCTHLNACYNDNKLCSISNIVKCAAQTAIGFIEEMQLDQDDIARKDQRLGIALQNYPDNIEQALFGAKKFVREFKTEEVLKVERAAERRRLEEEERVRREREAERLRIEEEERAKREAERLRLEEEQKAKNKNVQFDCKGVKKPNLLKYLVNTIVGRIEKDMSKAINDSEKDNEKTRRSNYFNGFIPGLQQKNGIKERLQGESYRFGYQHGTDVRSKLSDAVDGLYVDDATLKPEFEVDESLSLDAKKKVLSDKVAENLGYESYSEYLKNLYPEIQTRANRKGDDGIEL